MEEMNKKIMTEEELEKELLALVEELSQDVRMEKQIDRYIKRKIRKFTVSTVLIVLSVIAVVFLLISPGMNAYYLNPAKENKDDTFFYTLRSYYETTHPYTELVSVDVSKKGFAEYELGMNMVNPAKEVIIGQTNVWVDVIRGKYKNWKDPEMYTSYVGGRFDNSYINPKEELESLKELPKSANIYLSVSEKEPKNLEELKAEEIDLFWIEVYQPNVELFQGGLSMAQCALVKETDARENLTVEELKEVYLSNLKQLIDHENIWGPLGLGWGNSYFPPNSVSAREQLEACYEDAQKLTALETRNYCISGKRDEVVAYLEKTDVTSVTIDHVDLY